MVLLFCLWGWLFITLSGIKIFDHHIFLGNFLNFNKGGLGHSIFRHITIFGTINSLWREFWWWRWWSSTVRSPSQSFSLQVYSAGLEVFFVQTGLRKSRPPYCLIRSESISLSFLSGSEYYHLISKEWLLGWWVANRTESSLSLSGRYDPKKKAEAGGGATALFITL